MPLYKNLTTALLRSIGESGLPFQALERESGIKRQSLMKFVAGEQSLRLDLADKLAQYFGLRVESKPSRRQVAMSRSRDRVHVGGRLIVLDTGDQSQTVNICYPANEPSEYEEVKRFAPEFAVTKEWLERYADLESLKKELRAREKHQLRRLTGVV